ncbi:MAG: RluA family pseudouridine synthase [Lachnospiraceae bacterium]|nr:RluA family pseudouridine synthase [Lachnospiraceae bacterium]
MNRYVFNVDEEQAGERLDVLLAVLYPEKSRSSIKKLIENGMVNMLGPDGEEILSKQLKPSYQVKEDDRILLEIPPDEFPEAVPEDIPLDILYEDDDLIVVNKPKGMVVHPAPGHSSGTLVNAVLFHCGGSLSGIGGVLRPGIVHRIDRDTTGSVIICKNDRSHAGIAAQLADHSLGREYHALVIGRMPSEDGTVDAPIARSKTDRKKMAVCAAGSGKRAVTHYHVLRYFPDDNISYISCRLETGRTHQIRVHMSHIHHPVLNDEVYGGVIRTRFKLPQGQCLHAKTLDFIHPVSGETVSTDAPLPEYFSHLLEVLR